MFFRKYKTELFIFCAAIISQLIFLFIFIHLSGQPQILSGDGREYYTLGQNLLEHGQFRLSLGVGSLPESLRTPLYPLFIALCLSAVHQIWFISLIQIILSALIALVLYQLSRFLLTGRWQILPVILYLANPYTWFTSAWVMSEILYTLFFILSIYFLFKYLHVHRLLLLAFSILLLALTVLVRPVSFYLFFLYFLFIVIYQIFSHNNWRCITRSVILFIATCLLLIFPWCYRNYQVFNSFQLSSVQNYNLYFYNARLLYATVNGLDKDSAEELLNQRAANDLAPLALANKINYADWRRSLLAASYYKNQALMIFKSHILSYVRLHLVGTLPFFFDSGWRDVLAALNIDVGQPKSLTLLLTQSDFLGIWNNITQNFVYFTIFVLGKLYYLLMFILAFLAVFFVPRRIRLYTVIIYLLILYFAAVSSPVANARYRYPVEPLILLVATMGLSSLSKGRLPDQSSGVNIKTS